MKYSSETISQARGIFLKAADYIRQYGWQEKGMGKDGEPRCSMGALASAHPSKKWDKQTAKIMYKQLHDKLNGITLTEFNRLHRNGEKVAKLFEETAKSYEDSIGSKIQSVLAGKDNSCEGPFLDVLKTLPAQP